MWQESNKRQFVSVMLMKAFILMEVSLGFYATDGTTNEGTTNLVKDALVSFGMPLQQLRFPTYDEAANMSGAYNDCQA
jgi:hypothetical protein